VEAVFATIPRGYLPALALTLAIEVPIYGLGFWQAGWWRGWAAGLVVNLISHPLIFIVLPVPAVVGEPIAWAVEAVVAALFVRRRMRFEDVLMVVLAANFLSLVIGWLVLR
jgi:hypothetical protein